MPSNCDKTILAATNVKKLCKEGTMQQAVLHSAKTHRTAALKRRGGGFNSELSCLAGKLWCRRLDKCVQRLHNQPAPTKA
jgi:7-cyano-7-deazaguanine synthase in queuosine biosynthesis